MKIPVKKAKNLKDAVSSFTEDDIKEIGGYRIFAKGNAYYKEGAVTEINYSRDLNILSAIVEGSEEYSVSLNLDGSAINAECTCPYGEFCKHMVAVLVYAFNEDVSIDSSIATARIESSMSIDDYLDTLSKAQLIALVKDFAPQSFRIEIQNRHAGKEKALSHYSIVKKAISKLFRNDNLLRDPSGFESALMLQLSQLRGLEKQIPEEIGSLIVDIIKEIDNNLDEGYLDDYYEDESFNAEDFTEFTLGFIKVMNFDDKSHFLKKLSDLIGNQNYDTFYSLIESCNDIFSENELPALKKLLLEDYKRLPLELAGQYFQITRPLLLYSEQERILSYFYNNNEKWLIELVRLYEDNENIDLAIQFIKKYIDKNKKETFWNAEEYYSIYFDLLVKNNCDITEAAYEAVRVCKSSKILLEIAKHLVDTNDFEYILGKSDPIELFYFYQAESRIEDGYRLLKQNRKISEDEAYEFFKKNKHAYPEDSKRLFCKLIEKNLQFTGDSYYYKIEELLRNIKSIDRKMAVEIASDLRQTYQRRRNLIKIISDI